MICMFCSNRKKCWEDKSDEMLVLEWVKCNYADYALDEEIGIDELLIESDRRVGSKKVIEENE